MIAVLWAAALVLLFVVLLRVFGLVPRSREVIDVSRRSLAVIRDPALDDRAKETTLQANTVVLFRHFGVLALGGAAALLIPAAVLVAADAVGWASLDAVVDASMSPAFLVTTGVVALIALALPSRSDAAAGEDYSATDRTLHRLAFRTREPQIAVADLEDRIFRKPLAASDAGEPVFITALPRAGTTLLLEIFAASPEFASHLYRDMPFVLTPLLWNALSSRFQRESRDRERAHGDGMRISADSPEALEEVLWMAFHPDRYTADRIRPWSEPPDPEFATFFRGHTRKIVLLRGAGGGDGPGRYVSKNNLNVARIEVLRQLFPRAPIVVPFRDPRIHAASLLRQHLNFLAIHERDSFAREYMREIGHFDFGANLAPIDFGGWLDDGGPRDAGTLSFWLEYWVAAYRYLLDRRGDLLFVGYDDFCRTPEPTLRSLAAATGASDPEALLAAARRVRPPGTTDVDLAGVSSELQRRAADLHEELRARAIVQS